MNPKFTDEQLSKLRYRCQTDLWFLCNDVLDAFSGNRFSETPHKSMCDFYVQKDPSYLHFRHFAAAYKGTHDRMMLVPRQTRKSGIKIIDNVQWIINWPEIRIMTCTATDDLSTAFINQLIHYFVVKGKAQRNPETNRLEGGDWSNFQLLFPEHCITEREANEGEYITPMRYDPGNNFGVAVPTAGTLSMNSSTSGWRCDILDFDDPVSDRNSETGTQLEKLNDRMAMISELLMTNGFRHTVATRYQPDDPYGKVAGNSGITELYGDFEREGLKYMCRPCWWLKGQPYQQPDYSMGCPEEDKIERFYPNGLAYSELKKKFNNPRVFFSQQLNDPHNAVSVEFTEELIRSCMIDHTALPKSGLVFAFWDMADTAKKTSDETGGVVGLLDDQRRWWLIDIIKGRFNFTERCHQIVKAISIHHPKRTGIEDVRGAQDSMREPIDREAKSMKIALNIDWVGNGKPSSDQKYMRICGLHPWMTGRRLFFLNTLPHMDDLVRQFRNSKPKNSMSDDIPDAISRMVSQYTRYAVEVKAPTSKDDERRWQEIEEREFNNMIFRKGRYEPQPEPMRDDPRLYPGYAIDELFK